MNDEVINDTFHARDVFDPDSLYNKIRARYNPELKRRGQFYSWEANRIEQGAMHLQLAAADFMPEIPRKEVTTVILFSDDPTRMIEGEIEARLQRVGVAITEFSIQLHLPSKADQPRPGTRCRLFLLTGTVVERLCGASSLRSKDWMRSALRHVFIGMEKADNFQVSGILAAVAEFDGEFTDEGECVFPEFELPRHASNFETLPDDVVFVVVIEGGVG